MSHLIARPRRIVMAAAIAALLGCAALLSVSSTPAEAAFRKCPRGEFCLYFNEDANGGIYHFGGNDSNLGNDRYEGEDTGETVGNTSRYATNNGVPARRSDVIVSSLPGLQGARGCIRRGAKGPLPRKWWNSIESYRWVTRSECAKAGIIKLG
jgi:peptidase inhibitor family I36